MSNFYDALERADGIIITTPELFGNIPAKLKAVFDRTMHLLKCLRLKDKAGCAISVSPYRNGGQERAIEVIQSWMLLQGMAVVGDGSTGAVVSPALEDRIGRQTALENANKLCDLVERTRKSSCWGG
jgi:multimeric flavodoxin WrbA